MNSRIILLSFLFILLSWSVINIVVAIIRRTKNKDKKHYFWEMNGLWNIVNFGIALYGIIFTINTFDKLLDGSRDVNAQINIIGFNIPLDIIYCLVGLILKRQGSVRLKGYGDAVTFQGGFLLIFDILFVISLLAVQ